MARQYDTFFRAQDLIQYLASARAHVRITKRISFVMRILEKRMKWFKRKWHWATQNKLFWLNLALILASIAAIWVWPAPKESDFRIRTLAMAMQLIGVATVWMDLAGAANMFGKAGMLSHTWTWLKAGFGRRDAIVGMGASASAACTSSGRLTTRWPMDSSADASKRLEAIEKNIGKIDEDINAMFTQIDQQGAVARDLATQEANARAQAVAEVRRELGEVAAGNFQVLAFGAVWLAIGIVLSTWAPELAEIVAGK